MHKAIVLGNDHTNTLGVVQCLGIEGYVTDAYLWGNRTGLVSSSKYINNVFHCDNPQDCIEQLLRNDQSQDKLIPIICCCDSAALTVEQNKVRLSERFIFEHTNGDYNIEQLQNKDLQVHIAKQCGFNVPKSLRIPSAEAVPDKAPFEGPYIYKPEISLHGAKADITISKTWADLKAKLIQTFNKYGSTGISILIQQYIEHDYELSILGCAKSDGMCIIPANEDKLTQFPKGVGLECVSNVYALDQDCMLAQCIRRLIKRIGYVGLFSVELMHSKHDDNIYFTEINLRNDGANSFILQYGFNLPAIHIADLLKKEAPRQAKQRPGFYIWELHHLQSMKHGDISKRQWLNDLKKAKGYLLFRRNDLKPFFRQLWLLIAPKLHL